MRRIFILFLSTLFLTAFQSMTNNLQAQENNGILTIKRCQDFTLTGDGSSPAWRETSWIDVPQRTPQKKTYQTRAKVLYSATGIYVLFDCEDTKLNSDFTEDNVDLYEGDVVEVFLWPGEDFPVYFEYELSPLNYELPIIIPNDKGRFFRLVTVALRGRPENPPRDGCQGRSQREWRGDQRVDSRAFYSL